MRPCRIKQISRSGSVPVFLIFIMIFCLIVVGDSWGERNHELIQRLRSKDSGVRKEAARALAELRDPSTVGPLATILKQDGDWEVRASAEDALVKIGAPAIELLASSLKDNDWHVRRRAVRALGKIKDPQCIEPLGVALKSDKDSFVRKFAARGLGEINDARAAEILLPALKDNNLEIIIGAHNFFIRRGEPGTEGILVEALNNSWDKPMVMDFLNCGNDQLKNAALDCARKRGFKVISAANWTGPKWGGE